MELVVAIRHCTEGAIISRAETAPQTSFTSFEESTAEDWAILQRQMAFTQTMVANHVMTLLRALDSDHGGYPVTRLAHSLQTASRAERAGKDDEYVLCALLHDIGDTLAPYNHPAIAADILRGRVSDANLFMVEQHGIFQGWYFWHHIGLDRNAREIFRSSPWFDRTADFCARFDQPSFDPGYENYPLVHFEPLVRAHFATAPSP